MAKIPTDIQTRVLNAIDMDGLLSYLCELIAIPSLGGKESPAQEQVATQMEHCGLGLDVWELDFADVLIKGRG